METITARLSELVSEPELSQMWESERAELGVPEVLFEAAGTEVTLRFEPADQDPRHEKLKRVFENALQRFRPRMRVVQWARPESRYSSG